MDVRNLAIVFGTVVFGEEDISRGGDLFNVQNLKVLLRTLHRILTLLQKDTRMDDLIHNAAQLFEDPLPSSSPPLPDAPHGEPTPVYTYGSSHTRVGSVVSRPLSPRQNEDFAPRLPPRPAYSIHPSLRASNPVSPTQATMDIPPIPPRSVEEPTVEESHILISPPPSPSALSPHPSSVSLPIASEFSIHQRSDTSNV